MPDVQPASAEIDVSRLKRQRFGEPQPAAPEEHEERSVAPPSEAATAGIEESLDLFLRTNLRWIALTFPHPDFLAADVSAANEPEKEGERPKPLPLNGGDVSAR